MCDLLPAGVHDAWHAVDAMHTDPVVSIKVSYEVLLIPEVSSLSELS